MIIPFESLSESISSLQEKHMVLVGGCFDLLHYGHISFLIEAKKQGDVLIVGINSDKSVREYKGPNRPINPEEARSGVVAALEVVDYVFLFDDTIPNRWLELINPQVHCNSSEYGEKCVEKPVLDKIGARLYLVTRDFNDGLSTTEILNKSKFLKPKSRYRK